MQDKFIKYENLKNGTKDQNVATARGHNKPTTRRKHYPYAGKPGASNIFRKIRPLCSSSKDEKEYTPEMVTLKEEEQKN